MSTDVYSPLDIFDIPVALVGQDMSIVDFNVAFGFIAGISKEFIGHDIREIRIFRDLSLDLAEVFLKRKNKSLYLQKGDKVFELRISRPQLLLSTGWRSFGYGSPDREDLFLFYLIDVTRFINAEKELLRKNRELMIANSISNIFIASPATEEVYAHILEKCMVVGDFGIGCIVVPSQETGYLEIKTQRGFSLAFQKAVNTGQLDDIIKCVEPPMRVFETKELEGHDIFLKEGVLFLVIVPLISGGAVLGYLVLGNRKERVFDLELASIISLIGNNVSLVLDKIRLFKEMERLSITDPLTGLFNRRYFYDALEKEIERVKRYKSSFSIVLLDIDDFKRVNDEYGHLAGDRVLQILADILRRTLRKVDIIARYGGEEFILLLPNTEKSEAELIANRIREEVSKTVFECRSESGVEVICSITISGGITSCPDDFIELDKLLNASDRAMYEAKSLGKNRIVLFHREQDIFEHGGKK